MIASFPKHRCVVCYCPATRVTADEYGEPLPLCERCPSPEEIRLRTAALRATWSDEEYWCRYYQCAHNFVRLAQDVRFDTPVSLAAPRAHRSVSEET